MKFDLHDISDKFNNKFQILLEEKESLIDFSTKLNTVYTLDFVWDIIHDNIFGLILGDDDE